MKFTGKDGQQIELKILGYQFPTNFDNEWDANWLRIYLNVKSNVGYWQTVDPSLTTWEVEQLIKWFLTLSQDNEVDHTEITFIEPNLSFQLLDKVSNKRNIQIKFDFESRPQSADDDKEYFVTLQFSTEDLAAIANELTIELNKFPVRIFPTTSVTATVENDKKPWWKFW